MECLPMEAEHVRSHTRLFVDVALMATDIEHATLCLLRWAGACRLKVDRAHVKPAKENFWKLLVVQWQLLSGIV